MKRLAALVLVSFGLVACSVESAEQRPTNTGESDSAPKELLTEDGKTVRFVDSAEEQRGKIRPASEGPEWFGSYCASWSRSGGYSDCYYCWGSGGSYVCVAQ